MRVTFAFKVAAIKAAIVLIPSYAMAYLTDKMVYVVPTLAAAAFFASNFGAKDVKALVDDGEDSEDDGDPDADHLSESAD